MKNSCIRLFSFRPENYTATEQYLGEMLQQGWRLRWCKSIFAGFEKTEQTNIRYVVDPYAVTSPMNLKRFPKFRLNEYMENGWYAIGKSKGAYILYSDKDEAEAPQLEPNMEIQVRNTCRLCSLVFAVLLVATLWRCFTSPVILYNILLTDLYIALSAIALFLFLFHLCNTFLLFAPPPASPPQKKCIRYLIHDIGLFLLFIAAILLQARQQTAVLGYLLLPILVVVIGTFFMVSAAKKSTNAQESNKRLIPIVCVIAVVLLILIPVSIKRLQSTTNGSQRQQELLQQAESLPVVQLTDVVTVDDVQNNVKENDSILGNNLLYAEEGGDFNVFTNRTVMKNPSLAQPIFQYLYQQAQVDFKEAFQEKECNGQVYYKLEQADTYLFQKNSTVYFATVPAGIADDTVMTLLLSY